MHDAGNRHRKRASIDPMLWGKKQQLQHTGVCIQPELTPPAEDLSEVDRKYGRQEFTSSPEG